MTDHQNNLPVPVRIKLGQQFRNAFFVMGRSIDRLPHAPSCPHRFGRDADGKGFLRLAGIQEVECAKCIMQKEWLELKSAIVTDLKRLHQEHRELLINWGLPEDEA